MSAISDRIRESFKAGDDIRNAGLTTPEDIIRYDDLVYGDDVKWQVLDVYRSSKQEGKELPVIVSVHGGAWVYGDKESYQYYCMSLAQYGFAVVNFTYRLSPEYKYPAAIEDTNSVMAWVMKHAKEYGLDTKHIFAVGDSAGAHNLGLYAAISTNAVYAEKYGFEVPKDFKLSAIALNCGTYHVDISGEKDDMTTALMKDYLPNGGDRNEIELICVENYVTENYPPTVFMTCTGDFLKEQAPFLQTKLLECQVPHEFLFYGNKGIDLGHVFHLNVKLDMANKCNKKECEFFREYL